MKNYKSYIAALSYSFFVGLSFLMTKLVVPHATATLILAHRFTVAFISYSLYMLFSKKRISFNKKTIIAMIPVVLFYPLLFFSLQVYGLQYSSSSEGGIIFATVPIITIIIASLMGHRPSRIQILCVLLSVGGVLIIFANNLSSSKTGATIGISLLFLSALSSSIYTIIVKKVLAKTNVYELTFMIILVGFLGFNSLFFVSQSSINAALLSYASPFKLHTYILGIIYLGFFASVVASFSSNYALQYISAPQFSVFSNLSTLISVMAGALILNEPLSIRHVFGIPLILAGVLGTNFSSIIQEKPRAKHQEC